MIKVTIANNINTYIMGKSDGIMFKDVTKEDAKVLEELATKYGKQIRITEIADPIDFIDISNESNTSTESKGIVTDKRKIKKVFITNGKETIKITPDKLTEYLAMGYRPGRK